MRRELTIEYIGPSDEDRAHLRLLLRRIGESLAVRWRWGDEQHADALFVDSSILAGQMARARAHESGMRCVLLDAVATSANEHVLPRPFRADALRALLDLIAAERIPAASPPIADAVAFPADERAAVDPSPASPPSIAARRTPSTPTADDAEALFRRPVDPVPLARLPGLAQLEAAGIAEVDAPTLRTLHRAGRSAEPGELPRQVARGPSGGRALARVPLGAFLDGPLLAGPARIASEDLPPLALDPKEQAFHSPVPLASLRLWLRRDIAASEWVPLTTAQLRMLREQEPARDVIHLRWLAALDTAGGVLPRRLDPGGHFSLAAPFEVAPDFPQQRRIVLALAQPIRLHELAAAAGASMAAVFDVVAALDAIGLLACRPRERLQAPGPASSGGLWTRALGGLKGIGFIP